MLTLCPRRLNIISLFVVSRGRFSFKFQHFTASLSRACRAEKSGEKCFAGAMGQDEWRSIS